MFVRVWSSLRDRPYVVVPMKIKAQYKRVILKISGECLGAPGRAGVDDNMTAARYQTDEIDNNANGIVDEPGEGVDPGSLSFEELAELAGGPLCKTAAEVSLLVLLFGSACSNLAVIAEAGSRALVLGNGGGPSVRAADDCERAGLFLPEAPDKLRQEMKKYSSVAGSMLRNPFDIGGYHFDWAPVIDLLARWDGTDMMIWQISPDIEPFDKDIFHKFCLDQRANWLKDFKTVSKPAAVCVHASESDVAYEVLKITRQLCVELSIAFYPSVYRAAKAIDRFIAYHERLEQ